MRILLTNDDGIGAKGIQTLCRCLRPFAEVHVVAPDSERSATGHGITLRRPISLHEIELENCSGIKGFAVGGTPADCVKLAIQGNLIPLPDLVISGINHGQNLGTDVLYSGTVSAAIEGSLQGVPSMAVSLTSCEYGEFDCAAEFTGKICRFLFANGLTKDTLLNVNIPPLPKEQIRGVRITKLSEIKYTNVFQEKLSSTGEKYFIQSGEIVADSLNDPETDIYAIANNNISITPIHFDLTNYRIMDLIKQWKIN